MELLGLRKKIAPTELNFASRQIPSQSFPEIKGIISSFIFSQVSTFKKFETPEK